MKKIILFLLIFIIAVSNWFYSVCFSYEYSSDIQKAELIQTYIINLKKKIVLFNKKYNVVNDIDLKRELNELNFIVTALSSVINSKVDPIKNKKIITLVISKIKKSKIRITTILKKKKDKFEKNLKIKKDFFSEIWKKISKQLDNIIMKIYTLIKSKDIDNNGIWKIWKKEKMIISSLKNLNNSSLKLKYFWNSHFIWEKEMKIKFINLLKDIKKEILFIKNILES
jgi:hypothetical protein